MSRRPAIDYPKSQGSAAIGARLRRLSDRIDREAENIYRTLGIEFEQRWFGVLNQLSLTEANTVGGLAEALGVTHAAVSQVRAKLEKRGLISSKSDRDDARRTLLTLTPAGKRLAARLAPIWSALNEAARELDREAEGAVAMLDRLESALDRKSLAARVQARLER